MKEEHKELILKFVDKGLICLNCRKPIKKGLNSWCCFNCYSEFIKKYKLRTQEQINKKVFELIKNEVLK